MTVAMVSAPSDLEDLGQMENEREYVDRLESLGTWVDGFGTVIESTQAWEQARIIRELSKLREVSHDIAVAALRVECKAMRRLGKLGPAGLKPLKGVARKAASDLANLATDEWHQFLRDIFKNCTPQAALREFETAQEARRDFDLGTEIGNGRTHDPRSWSNDDNRPLMRAASEIIDFVVGEGEPFTVARAAADLAAYLERYIDDPIDRLACHQAIRLAMREDERANAQRGEETLYTQLPPVVTYFEHEVGWVRLPRERASVEQFRFHVEYRERQGRELLSRAGELRDLLNEIDAQEPVNFLRELTG